MPLGVAHVADDRPGAGEEPVPGYRLAERIGAGGSGEVWRAEGPGGFPVALKFIRLAGHATPGGSDLRALEILKAIRHPNLLACFGSWMVGDHLVLGMELADRTLWDRFVEAVDGGLAGIPRAELLDAMEATAAAVDALNAPGLTREGTPRPGIQHRDLKPRNILLVGGGVKVGDFGLARWLERSQASHTGHGWTPAYAAPEFFRGTTAAQSDQYSLAVTYCHLRGGRLPFDGDPAGLTAGHLMFEPDLSRLPAPERPAVLRAMDKDPRRRWPDCRAFVAALRDAGPVPETIPGPDSAEAGADAMTSDRAPTATTLRRPAAESPPTPRRGRRVAASALVAGVLGLALLAREVRAPVAAARPIATRVAAKPKAEPPAEPRARDLADALLPPPAEEIVPPPAVPLSLTVPPTLAIAAGRGATLPLEVERHGVDGPIVLRFEDLPRGVTASSVTIAEGASRAEAKVAATGDAPEGRATVRVIAEAPGREDVSAELALDVGPRPGLEHRRRGRALLARGDAKGALAAFDEAVGEEPGSASAYLGRGAAHLKLGDPERALADFNRALDLDPKDPVALNNRGLAYRELGEFYKAIADYSEAMRLKPDDAVARFNRGLAYHRLGHEVEALADFDEALRLDPNLARARDARDEARARRGDAKRPVSRSSR